MAKRTEEEKQAWKDQMKGLAATIKAMPEEQRINFAAEFPVLTCEGHLLAPWNTCALITQCRLSGITPTQVAGFRQWKKIDRQVMKGQHACGYIMVPMGKGKKAAEPQVDDNGEQKKSGMRFKWVPMFDVTQTEVIDCAKVVDKPVKKIEREEYTMEPVTYTKRQEPAQDDSWNMPTIWDTDKPEPGKQYLITAPPEEVKPVAENVSMSKSILKAAQKLTGTPRSQQTETIKPDFAKPKQLPAPILEAEVVKPVQGLLFG